eukprot:gnl/TRDRNA2_/TRDRNA2_194842_c0_seq1.p1 gnl/TRDRNA2_/TRDRNA2_194842_c0~~gnl/TRDRNA2_/TRDRNA2_194842_c0_seq1.p1  ORF type:complete len:271 (-),score=65.99 gnl/TRDRNA2_/TRDRNA2_194842_c0_seq1:103-915(-)
MAEGVEAYPTGTHAQIFGLASKPELNDEHCVSRGVNPDNAERVNVLTAKGSVLSLRPANLKPAELLPGSRVVVVGLANPNAQKYNGQQGDVLSWQGDRWIVDLPSKERKSFRSDNLVILPEKVPSRKRPAEPEQVEVKKLKATDIRDLESDDEAVIAKCILRNLEEFPLICQKAICCIASKQTITVVHELAQHMTERQNDGLLRRVIRPGEKVKGIEDMDALEQCRIITEKKIRQLANMCKINYCHMYGFIKAGCKEPQFNRPPAPKAPP